MLQKIIWGTGCAVCGVLYLMQYVRCKTARQLAGKTSLPLATSKKNDNFVYKNS